MSEAERAKQREQCAEMWRADAAAGTFSSVLVILSCLCMIKRADRSTALTRRKKMHEISARDGWCGSEIVCAVRCSLKPLIVCYISMSVFVMAAACFDGGDEAEV